MRPARCTWASSPTRAGSGSRTPPRACCGSRALCSSTAWTRRRSTSRCTRARPRVVSASRRRDRKSTRLNSSHSQISYAVFCLKKEKFHVAVQKEDELSSRPLVTNVPPSSRRKTLPWPETHNVDRIAAGELNSFVRRVRIHQNDLPGRKQGRCLEDGLDQARDVPSLILGDQYDRQFNHGW